LKIEPRIKVENNTFFPDYTHTKMAGRISERYKIEPRISVPFMLELEYESNVIKKLLMIKEIYSWLQTFRPSNPSV